MIPHLPVRPLIDSLMTLSLLLLMSFPIMPFILHAALGFLLALLLTVHVCLQRRWYSTLGKGRYSPARTVQTAVILILPAVFSLSLLSGCLLLFPEIPLFQPLIAPARQLHLSMSYWAFLLSSVHLGFHGEPLLRRFQAPLLRRPRRFHLCRYAFLLASVCGLFLLIQSDIPSYLFFQSEFAFLDFRKPAVQIFLEQCLLMAGISFLSAQLLHPPFLKKKENRP